MSEGPASGGGCAESGEEELAAAKDAEVVPFLQLWRMVWPQAVVFCMMQLFMLLETHIYMPYLYTRVHCCGQYGGLGVGYDIAGHQAKLIAEEARSRGLEPPGTLEGAVPACDVPPFPTDSGQWSLSGHCVNKEYVEDSAQAVMATVKPWQKLTAMAVLPVCGALADSIGRQPVLVGFALMLVAACLLSALDSVFSFHFGDVAVLTAGILFGVSFQPKEAICSSTIADVMGHDEANKSRAFVMVYAVNACICCAVNFPIYLVLRMHLQSYAFPWLAFAGIAGLCAALAKFAMPETLPKELRKPIEPGMLNPVAMQWYAMRLIARDPVLIVVGFISLLDYMQHVGFISVRTSYLLSVGFQIEETLFPEMLAFVLQLPVSAFLFWLVPRIGAARALQLYSVLYFAAFFFVGPYVIWFGPSGAYVFVPLTFAATGAGRPAVASIVTERVEQGDQSKVLAAIAVFSSLGILLGVTIFSRVLFRATHVGMAKATPAFGGMAISACCLLASSLSVSMARAFPAHAADAPQAPLLAGGCCGCSQETDDGSSDDSSSDSSDHELLEPVKGVAEC